MKTYRLNKSAVESIELDENKFQVWKGSALMQRSNGKFLFISNPSNLRWATNFDSLEDAMENADQYMAKHNFKGSLKIFSGNLLFAKYHKGVWEVLEKPVKQLL